MVKKIVLEMLPSKDITISINGGKTLTIHKNNRHVKADEIYDLLDFSRGDIFEVECINKDNLDAPVIQFFEKLMSDIVKKLNKIPDSDDDEYLES